MINCYKLYYRDLEDNTKTLYAYSFGETMQDALAKWSEFEIRECTYEGPAR